MTKPIAVSELLSLAEYEKARLDMRKHVVALRKLRRVPVGNRLAFIFENRDTVLFQIHETVRAEGITDPTALKDECNVYNAVLPTPTELSATLVIDLPEGINVRQELQRLNGLERHTALAFTDGEAPAQFESITGTEGIAPNQHVRFRLTPAVRERFRDPAAPVFLKIDHPSYNARTVIDGETRRSLIEDLS